MSTLYELTNNLETLLLMIEENDGEFSDQCLIDTWESLNGEFEYKAEQWAKAITLLQMNAVDKKTEAKRLTEQAKKDEETADRMKSSLAQMLIRLGRKNLKTPLFTFNRIKENGKLVVGSSKDIPDEYKKTVVREVKEADKDKIRQALDNGEHLPFASYRNSISIS